MHGWILERMNTWKSRRMVGRMHGKRKDRMGLGKSKRKRPPTVRKAQGCRYHLPTASLRCGPGRPLSLLLPMGLLALYRAGPPPQPPHPPSRITQEGIQGQRTFPGQPELEKACLTNRNEGAAFQRQVLFWFLQEGRHGTLGRRRE